MNQLAATLAPEDNSPRLADQAYDSLLDLVLSGGLPGGSVIQERLLARRLNLSRTPIREALMRLEGEGLLQRTAGRILVVARISTVDFMEILAVRRLLESEAIGLAVGRLSPAVVADLTQAVKELRTRADSTAEDHRRLDDRLHETIAEASGNNTLVQIIRDMRRKTAMFDRRRIPERFQASCAEHLAILDAMASNERTMARQRIVEHIDNVRSSILRHLGSGELRP